ncbi:hypothetical protein Sste5346_003705 [Sporothrix stenoceras]|uniref:Major facilitator superfamily (MFS) profile domain-containing protein n=1 Tax=Sporothrix stenoceras TaxID=5173 RepID=A0ABR3ZDG9_9PEZI
MAGIFGIINTLGGCTNLILIDRVGRRKLFLTGLILLSVWLGVFSAASSEYATTGNPRWGKAGVAFVMIFIYTFGSTYAASPYAYAAETKGLTLEEVNLVFGESVEVSMDEISDNNAKLPNVDHLEMEA